MNFDLNSQDPDVSFNRKVTCKDMKLAVICLAGLTAIVVLSPSGKCSAKLHKEVKGTKHSPQKPDKEVEKDKLVTKVFDLKLGPSSKDPTLFWQVDYGVRAVRFQVKVSSPGSDWVAFGFSDRGDIEGADLCVLWVDWRGDVHFDDARTDSQGIIYRDVDKHQNCQQLEFLDSPRNETRFGFIRDFETCDPDDYIIEDGTTHLVFARGQGPLLRLTGVNATAAAHTGMKRVQLLKNLELEPSSLSTGKNSGHKKNGRNRWSDGVVKTLDVTMDRYHVDPVETTYMCRVMKLPEEFDAKRHMIQYNPLIQEGNEDLVHHMEVFHCEAGRNVKIPEYLGPCESGHRPKEIDVCRKVVAAWAMGAEPFVYPENVGLAIGGRDFNPYVMLEVHYNNPGLMADYVDSSGMQIHYTSKLRQYDAGIIEVGLEYTPKTALPPKMPSVIVRGDCIQECTAVGLPQEGITIFASQLHTHLTGVRIWTTHSRNGLQLPDINRDNHYSTHYQEIRILKRPVRVLPGDAMVTVCQDTTADRENVTLGGFAISDEMCVNYMHYYPKANLEVCKSSIDSDVLDDYFDFMNEWENQPTSKDNSATENFHAIEWTKLRGITLQELYDVAPLSMQCNQSSGARFPGYWNQMPQTKILAPLEQQPGKCGAYPEGVVPPYYQGYV